MSINVYKIRGGKERVTKVVEPRDCYRVSDGHAHIDVWRDSDRSWWITPDLRGSDRAKRVIGDAAARYMNVGTKATGIARAAYILGLTKSK